MKRTLAMLVVIALLAALAVAGAPSSGADEQATQSARTIKVTDNKYKSGGLTISKGAVSVPKNASIAFIWSNTKNRHDVTSRRGGDSVKSKTTSRAGTRYSHAFKKTTSLYCTVHPTQMKLKVNVR